MWTKPYGSTGKDVSVVSFGGMRFAEPQKIDEMAEIVKHGYDLGINYFDTAPGYSEDKSEDIMGAAFKQMDREKFYVSTKCSEPDGDKLRATLEKSLTRLGVEKIDFFHIWWVCTMEAWKGRIDGGAVAAVIKAKQEGLIEHMVISSHLHGDELAQVLDEAPFEGVTLGYNAINFPYRQAAIEASAAKNIGVVTMNPLSGGVIPQNAKRLDFLRGPQDKSVVEAAIRFNVSNPAITSALVGFANKDEVSQAAAAVDNFTPFDAERTEQIKTQVAESFDGLCTTCGYCLPCPVDIPIPQLMEAYNLKILDSDQDIPDRLKWHWVVDPAVAKTCTECGVCEDRCTQHISIRERLKEVVTITDEAAAKAAAEAEAKAKADAEA